MRVPSQLLQPLTENAVVHGLAHHEGAVVVHVGAQVQGDALQLRVVNTVAPQRPAIAAAQGGIGLRNLRQRLAIQFAGRASISAATGPDQNWIAEIRMPRVDGT